jgi:O-antigen/teichoic acid export membrane protein
MLKKLTASAQRQLGKRKGDLWLMSAKWSAPVLSLVGGLVAAANLKPEELGIVQAVMLIPSYISILQLGVFSGLGRNLPLYLAKKETGQAKAFGSAARQHAILIAGIGGIVATVLVIYFALYTEDPRYAFVACFLIPGLIFAPLRLQQNTVYSGMREFYRLGKSVHLQNFWVLICSLSTSMIGLTGMALKLGTQHLVCWLYLLPKQPIHLEGKANFRETIKLSKVGLPVMIGSTIFSWLSIADRSVIAVCLTSEDLGLFALATLATNAVRVFPQSISTLLYPRIAHTFGATGSSRRLRRYLWIGLGINLSLMIPVAILGYYCLPYLIKNFLPAYEGGIKTAQLTMLGAIFFAYAGPGSVLSVLRRNLVMQMTGLFCLGLVWLGGIAVVSAGYGIYEIAAIRIAAMAVNAVIVLAYVFYLTSKDVQCKE